MSEEVLRHLSTRLAQKKEELSNKEAELADAQKTLAWMKAEPITELRKAIQQEVDEERREHDKDVEFLKRQIAEIERDIEALGGPDPSTKARDERQKAIDRMRRGMGPNKDGPER